VPETPTAIRSGASEERRIICLLSPPRHPFSVFQLSAFSFLFKFQLSAFPISAFAFQRHPRRRYGLK
jgi:hypothetical protein